LAKYDAEDDGDDADDSSLSTVGMIIKEIADKEEVLFMTTTRTYDFNTQNEQLIGDLEDKEDTRKFYHFKKHNLRKLADVLWSHFSCFFVGTFEKLRLPNVNMSISKLVCWLSYSD
jgi:hypothetical protein